MTFDPECDCAECDIERRHAGLLAAESKRTDDYCRRWLDTRAALAELVRLKEYKDKFGKTPGYIERQPAAWDEARRVLNLPDL